MDPRSGGRPRRPAVPGAIPLGRVLGFPLAVRWTVLLLVGLVTLLAGQFLGYGVGFGFVVCLLLSVLLHELGHALTARRLRLRVRVITLDLLGGHTELVDSPPTPRAELLVSLAGPAVSLLLGVGAFGAATVLPAGGPLQVAVLAGLANLVVALFNALPGLPLDGGGALRAIVWAATGDRHRGTRAAARGGQAVSVLTVTAAVVLVFTGRLTVFGLVLLLLVGLDLWRGATAHLRYATAAGRLPTVDLERVTRPVFPVPAGTPLAEAERQLAASPHPEAALVVADPAGRPVAMVLPQAAAAVPPERRHSVGVETVARDLTGVPVVPVAVLSDPEALRQLRELIDNPHAAYLVTFENELVGVLAGADLDRLLRAGEHPGSAR